MTDLRRNDLAQYDDLADQWWEASGGFAALHWLGPPPGQHTPPAPGPGAGVVGPARHPASTTPPCSSTAPGCSPPPTGSDWTCGWSGCGPRSARRWPGGWAGGPRCGLRRSRPPPWGSPATEAARE